MLTIIDLLNEPAGKVAAETIKYVVPLLMQAWDGHLDPNRFFDQIIPMFHHPAFVDGRDGHGGQEGRHRMFSVVRKWWEEMDESRRQFYRRSLSREGVEQGRNHKEGHDSGHGCGKPIHRTKPKNSGGEFGVIGEDLGKAMGGAIEQAFTGNQSGGTGLGGFLGGVAATALGETLLGGSAGGSRKESYSESYDDGNVRGVARSYGYSGEGQGGYGERQYERQEAEGLYGGGGGYAAAGYSAGGEYGHSEQRHGQNYSHTPIHGGVEYGSGGYDGGGSFVVEDHHRHHPHHHQPEGNSHHHHHHREQPTYERIDSYRSDHSTNTLSYPETSSYVSESSYSAPATEYPYAHPQSQYHEYPTNASYRTETYTQSSSYGGGQSSCETSTRRYPGSYETKEVVYSGEGDEGYVVERSYKKYSDGEEERKYKSYKREEGSEDEFRAEDQGEIFEEVVEEAERRAKKWRKKHGGSGDEGSGDEYYGSGDEDDRRRYSGSGDEEYERYS